MKATLRLVCATLAVASSLSAQTESAKPAGEKPAGEASAPAASASMDKVSYFIGSQIGGNIANNFKQQGVEIDLDSFLGAVRDQFEGKPSKYKPEELEAAMKAFEKVMQGKQAEMQAKQAAKAGEVKAAGAKFLAENGKKEGVKTTASGLQYEVLKQGDGAKPVPTDKVNVHYHGTLLNGKVFDSSVDRGEPITFGVQEVIKGWTEGLQLMSVGSKYKFYIPSDLAYGDNGAGADIGPGETLVFEVELLKIEK
ncbi:FKBP-type peptidyl-prolyl cis-trans isomerase [Prosthecobacter dejongeii]|uniref:Peptidyl-prolyl cis-trans isomerase n=1 Tax=Prosthecobacter dejongeii TaxID=48465 RepID=A0A7W7YH74_9BACT|nr:FKBP-type peptidyl-prolyl cis-trans isomerase [Prosthecobacter dejongeii]